MRQSFWPPEPPSAASAPPARRALLLGCLGLALTGCLTGGAEARAAAPAARLAGPRAWVFYHRDAAGSGVAPAVTSVRTRNRAWTSPALDGQLYGEPLVSAGRVYVATENDTVYALSATAGRVIWSRHVGTPVPAGNLPCGNIRPTVGITGTPVIDQARGEIFVVADILRHGRPAHVLVGLRTSSGARELTREVDPVGADRAALLQRTGLTLDAGRVIFGFGGNYGDCPTYRGRVVAVPERGGQPRYFTADAGAGQSQGAIWMGGAAPVVDSQGHVWVTVGNGSVDSSARPYDHSDAALELTPSMRLRQFFAPGTWASDNARDLDLSTAPALLPGGQALIAGKSGTAYLVDRAHLGGIGGQRAILRSACGGDIDGGSAVVGRTVFLPCLSGIIAVQASRSALHLRWRSGTGGGPPIVAAGLVWTIGNNGELYGLGRRTGRVRQEAAVGVPANSFPTPALAAGHLIVASGTRVVAFTATSGPAGRSGPADTATNTTPASQPAGSAGAAGRPGPPAGAVGGIAAGVIVLAGLGWLLWRRRNSPAS